MAEELSIYHSIDLLLSSLITALEIYMKEQEKAALKKELDDFEKNGVKFLFEGSHVESGENLVDMLLGDEDCTYMRNYVFKGAKIVEIGFNKIKLR